MRRASPGRLRLRALREFEAMPVPSQETEEWRYTDLSGFALDFAPYTPWGPRREPRRRAG